MKCSKCGSELLEDSNYCNKCGSRIIKEENDDIFAYLCPICKTPNHKSSTYCIKCGHWLLDSNFKAVPLTEKEYYQSIKNENYIGQKKEKHIFPIVFYSLFLLLFFLVSVSGKIFFSLLIILYGIINIIVPLKKLLINRRLIGVVILIAGIVTMVICSNFYNSNTNNISVVNIEEYKSQCTTISYDNLAHETEKYVNKKVKLTGQVIQVQENGNRVMLLVNVTKGDFNIYRDTVWINYTLKIGEKHIIENDIINLWGTVKGRKTYKTVLGSQNTIPEIDAVVIEISK
ncbi:MAG: hypothetical protein PWQ97_1136 [Tepidanaerobacteraceae bacterium]|nr:hypothetical protein [Tepidanaerobacteraceae bacterium]